MRKKTNQRSRTSARTQTRRSPKKVSKNGLVDGQGNPYYCRLCVVGDPKAAPLTYFPVKIPILMKGKPLTVKKRTLTKWMLHYSDVCLPCARQVLTEMTPEQLTPTSKKLN